MKKMMIMMAIGIISQGGNLGSAPLVKIWGKTPTGDSAYPFDLTISDGTWRQEFKNTSYVEVNVPIEATYTFRYIRGNYEHVARFRLTLDPSDTREFEFYALDPALAEPRKRPYLLFQEKGAVDTLTWLWDSTDNILAVEVQAESGKYWGVDTWIYKEESDSSTYAIDSIWGNYPCKKEKTTYHIDTGWYACRTGQDKVDVPEPGLCHVFIARSVVLRKLILL